MVTEMCLPFSRHSVPLFRLVNNAWNPDFSEHSVNIQWTFRSVSVDWKDSFHPVSGFKGVELTKFFSSIFHFAKVSSFKTVITHRKKMNQNFVQKCTFTHRVLQRTLTAQWPWVPSIGLICSPSPAMVTSPYEWKFFEQDEKLLTNKQTNNQTKFTKFCWAVLEKMRWQKKQDWRNDWRSNTFCLPHFVAWGIINHNDYKRSDKRKIHVCVCMH